MITWRETAARLRGDASFRLALTRRVAESEHAALRWETCPVSASTRERPYEEVLLESPALARRRADPSPFARALAGVEGPVARFSNLGGDARLVVPTAAAEHGVYTHLASFVRGAPASQVDALWQAVGEELEGWWARSDRPVWLNTAGLGVSWLHVRLDSRPKYYRHRPFCRW